jgi:regulator of sigma E protease
MNYMSILQAPLVAVVFYILPYLLAIVIIVFVHEAGHFYVGRLCGVKVETFSIGFGREIFGFNDKHGTRWKFCWIPLGGYVKFLGDANATSLAQSGAEHIPGSLHGATLPRRMAIVAAGPFANFLLAIAIFTVAFAWVGTPINEPRIDSLTEGGAAKVAGLQPGDLIRKIDGQKISSFMEIREVMFMHGENSVALDVDRAGQPVSIILTPRIVEVPDGFGSTARMSLIGISHDFSKDPQKNERLSVPAAFTKAVSQTWFVGSTTLRYLGKVITGAERSNQMNGPLGGAKIAGDFASQGVWPFITFIALISVSIGLVNLFPIPMLDGGHLLFYCIEAILGRPVSQTAQEWSFRVGLSAILMFMIFVTFNDIGRYKAMWFGS